MHKSLDDFFAEVRLYSAKSEAARSAEALAQARFDDSKGSDEEELYKGRLSRAQKEAGEKEEDLIRKISSIDQELRDQVRSGRKFDNDKYIDLLALLGRAAPTKNAPVYGDPD